MKNILFIFLVLCLTETSAQNAELLTPAQLKADADYYFKTLYANHPNPYYYYSLNEFEDKKNSIYAQLDKPLTHEQFAWIIGEMNSCLDMHSMLQIYFLTHWRKNYFVDKSIKFFPNVRFERENVYLKNTNKKVQEINGFRVTEIVQDFKRYFNWKLPYERNKYSLEASFSSFLMNKYHFEAPFKVKFGNSEEVQILEGYTLDEFLKEASTCFRGGKMEYAYRIYPKSSIAIFNIITFDILGRSHLKKKWEEFIKEVNRLNIQNVFYDLTANGGGDYGVLCKEGVEALDIIKHDSVYWRLNRIDRVNSFNRKYKVNNVIAYPNKNSNTLPKTRKLFVLSGINTMSAGDYFCRIVAMNRLGTLVGQNTGEPTTAFSASHGDMLPHSKIPFIVATALFDFSDYFDDETLHPDVYWDVNHCREFTEKELMDIVERCKEIK